MNISENQHDCQIPCIRNLAYGPQEAKKRSFKFFVRTKLGPQRSRIVEKHMNKLLNFYARIRKRENKPAVTSFDEAPTLIAGDWVRIRTLEEIEMTLDHFQRLKGCSFAKEMTQYCGTNQKVLKSVERFVDERDLRIVRTKGIVILEGLTCQGMGSFGRCDRNCYFFWRVEWLEKVTSR
jgi:hypothetical protein